MPSCSPSTSAHGEHGVDRHREQRDEQRRARVLQAAQHADAGHRDERGGEAERDHLQVGHGVRRHLVARRRTRAPAARRRAQVRDADERAEAEAERHALDALGHRGVPAPLADAARDRRGGGVGEEDAQADGEARDGGRGAEAGERQRCRGCRRSRRRRGRTAAARRARRAPARRAARSRAATRGPPPRRGRCRRTGAGLRRRAGCSLTRHPPRWPARPRRSACAGRCPSPSDRRRRPCRIARRPEASFRGRGRCRAVASGCAPEPVRAAVSVRRRGGCSPGGQIRTKFLPSPGWGQHRRRSERFVIMN